MKTSRRDDMYVTQRLSADDVLARLPVGLEEDNRVHLHKGLGMRSPWRRLP